MDLPKDSRLPYPISSIRDCAPQHGDIHHGASADLHNNIIQLATSHSRATVVLACWSLPADECCNAMPGSCLGLLILWASVAVPQSGISRSASYEHVAMHISRIGLPVESCSRNERSYAEQ